MNIEDYAQHMIQKHVLAITLAVIKTKPANATYETYLDHIRNKIKEQDMDSIIDITICEEDFNISDDFTHDNGDRMVGDDGDVTNDDQFNKTHDSVTILKNFELNDLEQRSRDDAMSLLDVMTELDSIDDTPVNKILIKDSQNICTQSTNFDESQITESISNDKANDIAGNIEIDCETYSETHNNVGCNSNNVSNNVYYNNIINSQLPAISKNNVSIAYHESNNLTEENRFNHRASNIVNDNITKGDANNIIIDNDDIDSQNTQLYTPHGFTSNTHVSQSQEDFIVANENLISRSRTGSHTENANVVKESNKAIRVDTSQDILNFYGNTIDVHDKITSFNKSNEPRKNKNLQNDYNSQRKRIKIDKNDKIFAKSTEFGEFKTSKYHNSDNTSKINFDKDPEEDYMSFSKNYNSINDTAGLQIRVDSNDLTLTTNFDTNAVKSLQRTELRFSPDDSQSLLALNENYSSKYINESFDCNEKVDQLMMTVDDLPIETRITFSDKDNEITGKEINEKQCELNENNFKDGSINSNDPIINLRQTENHTSEYKRKEFISNSNKVFSDNENDGITATYDFNESGRLKESVFNNLPNDGTKEGTSHQKKSTKEFILYDDTEMDVSKENDFSENETETQSETVSFKTLEELNRIKSYLNRRERRLSEGNNSLDSGFKSSYRSASQNSEVWINESAHSLLCFITVSQLTHSTVVIADEISKVLGKLVDKLHEVEIYPNFLEELLDKVNVLLNNVYEGTNGEINTLRKRDDNIHRLLLLNRSKHIMNYTIEKITVILEKTISDLTEDAFELEDVERTENLCYIFHILEVLLKRVKSSFVSSEISLPNSQDEDVALKRSSLTEIWRRKWNLTKSDISEGSTKKKCVLTECSEVLNNLIVQAIDGYSLVSFAALQCFNLLQN